MSTMQYSADGSSGREFANAVWRGEERIFSILPDDPSLFAYFDRMELMGHSEFIQYILEGRPRRRTVLERW